MKGRDIDQGRLLLWAVGMLLGLIVCEWSTHAATTQNLDAERATLWREIKEPNLSAFIPPPVIELKPYFLKEDRLPPEVKTLPQYDQLQKWVELLKEPEKEAAQKAYLEASKLAETTKNPLLREWLEVTKADLMFVIHRNGQWSFSLEEYQELLQRYPLNSEIPRALYQMALVQLEMGFYSDVVATTRRGLKDFSSSEYAPLYRLLMGEQALRSGDDRMALEEFSAIVDKYPKTQSAIDSSFRQAFLEFRRGRFKEALQTYNNLEKFHSGVMAELRMRREPSSTDKLVDRMFFAETLYQNFRLREAADLFQYLANLFPREPAAPFLYLRLSDTYLWRGQVSAARVLYEHVIERWKEPLVQAVARIRIADLNFLSKDVRAAKQNQEILEAAFQLAQKAKNDAVAALALERLAAHHLYFKALPRAQAVLKQARKLFPESANKDWVFNNVLKTVEREILDHYAREDYMAALATFLVSEREQLQNFSDSRVLLNLADTAKRLSLNDKAVQILNRVIYIEKTSAGRQEALLRLIEILIIEGQYAKAGERLRRFNFAYPVTPLAHLYEYLWGRLYLRIPNKEKAIEHFERALVAAGSNPRRVMEIRDVYTRLAALYEEEALPLKAAEYYKLFIDLVDSIENNKLSSLRTTQHDRFQRKVSRYKIADLYFNQRDFVRAMDAYRSVSKEIQEEPFLSHARYRIAECFLLLGDRQAALKAFSEVVSEDKENIWVKAAQAYIKSVEMEVKSEIRVFN